MKRTKIFFLIISLLLINIAVSILQAQSNSALNLHALGTRSWIRLKWNVNSMDIKTYHLYWSTDSIKPSTPQAVITADKHCFYIREVLPETKYTVWIESIYANGKKAIYQIQVATIKQWILDPDDVAGLSPATSVALPSGMNLFWHDEFNDELLNLNKWSTNYYSTWDFIDRTNWTDFKTNKLPQPNMIFNGSTILLKTDKQQPVHAYWSSGRKISSIQTYDWNSNENLLDNSRGGYFEARVKRKATPDAKIVNTAFWFDSPGPDLKYYIEEGKTALGVRGIRPRGQVFEIDVFENLNSELVLHGNVDSTGHFQGNMGHFPMKNLHCEDVWMTHGMLWTPTSLRFYVNGQLMKEWSDPKNIKSPNHFMNVFLGTYGLNGTVDMEVDYIRYYQWPLQGNNELPNASFECNNTLLPWTGGTLSSTIKKSGANAAALQPGDSIEQTVYLNHSSRYKLSYWIKGSGSVKSKINNISLVKGVAKDLYAINNQATSEFTQYFQEFRTTAEYEDHKSTVKVTFINEGQECVYLDELELTNCR